MKRFIMALALAATVAPTLGFAQDRDPDRGGRDTDGADFHLADYVLGRGDFAPNGGQPQTAEIDPVLDDLISAYCGDRDVIIILSDDGLIEDWDCD